MIAFKRLIGAALLAAGTVAATFAGTASAAWPDKTVHYILPFPPGGESDIAARFQQKTFKQKFNQDMIVESKVGAGGALAWAQLNAMQNDGYTIMGINLPHIVLQPLEGNVQYKTDDLQSVYWFHFTPDALIVTNDSPYKTIQDFIAAAKAKPGILTLAGSGTNSANHVAHEKLNLLGGIKTTYVPFKGTGDLISSVLGGHVTGTMSYITFAQSQKGKVRVLAVATEKRHPMFPDVPTFREVGLNWVDGAYRGVAVPKSTPPDIQKRISDAFDAINKDPEFRKQMVDGGFVPVDVTLDQIPAFLVQRKKDYEDIARKMGLLK
jgi:tripartite-type tricarboxylate transporter receptor subunit TctC